MIPSSKEVKNNNKIIEKNIIWNNDDNKKQISSEKNKKEEYKEINIQNNDGDISNDINKKILPDKNDSDHLAKNKLNKVKTYEKDRRIDRFGNLIIHGGKQKVSFIDKISNNQFTEIVKVENYKKYNKMEETSHTRGNNCCLLM